MDSTKLFNGKSKIYSAFRPHYSEEAICFLYEEKIIRKTDVIADIGAGTGILTQALLKRGNMVFAVEPNQEMLEEMARTLQTNKRAKLINATAEHIPLGQNTVDVITAAQSFHWFNMELFQKECKRLLGCNKNVILMWNRKVQNCVIELERKKIRAEYCTVEDNYNNDWQQREQAVYRFYNGACFYKSFDNPISNTYGEFMGRALSDSRAPFPETSAYKRYADALTTYFAQYSNGQLLTIPNETIIYWGKMGG